MQAPQHSMAQHGMAQRGTARHGTAQRSAAQHSTTPYDAYTLSFHFVIDKRAERPSPVKHQLALTR